MRHNGHIRQRSEGSFEIRYSIGNDPVTGKWIVKTTTFKGTKKEAQRELNRILETIERNEYVEPHNLTTSDYLKQWSETVRSQVSPKTHERYDEIVNNFLIPAFGKHLLNKLTPALIQNAYNKWVTSGRRDKKEGGLAPRTRIHIHRILRSALKHAVRILLITNNPADAVMAPRAKKTIGLTLTIEQSAVLLKALQEKHPQLYWPVLLAITTGMRRGEIVALRWKNVDFDNETIRVVESVEQVKQNIRFKSPKTDRTRAVMLPSYAVQELKEWKEIQTKELRRLGVVATEDTFVCGRSWDGGILKPDSLTAEFRVAIRDMPNIPIVRFHDLRHSHATQLLKQGTHPKIAQERLGHSTITTTLDLYSHVVDTMQNDAVSKLDTAFRSAIGHHPKRGPQLG